jgi:hypothetical protein
MRVSNPINFVGGQAKPTRIYTRVGAYCDQWRPNHWPHGDTPTLICEQDPRKIRFRAVTQSHMFSVPGVWLDGVMTLG